MVLDGYKLKFATNCMQLKRKTEMQTKDLFHKKISSSLEIVLSTIHFVLFYINSIYLKKIIGLLDIIFSQS